MKSKIYEREGFVLITMFIYTNLFLLLNGYYFGIYDHSIMLPFIYKFGNPDLFPGDLLASTYKNTYTIYVPMMSILIKYFNTQAVFFILHYISMFFTFLGIFKISEKLFNSVAGFFSLILISSGLKFYIGGSPIFTNMLAQYNIALPLVLFGLLYFFKEKKIIAFILFGVAFNFHAMLTFYTFVGIGLYYLSMIKKLRFKQDILPILIFIMISLPTLIWILSDMKTGSHQEWVEILRAVQSHHVFPFSFPLKTYLGFLIVVFIGLFLNKYDMKRNDHKLILCIYGGMFILFVFGTVFTEMFPVGFFIKGQMFRSCKIPIIFTFIFLAGYIQTQFKSSFKGKFLYVIATLFLLLNMYLAFFLTLLASLISKKMNRELILPVSGFFFIFSVLAISFDNIFDVGVKLSLVVLSASIVYSVIKNKRIKSVIVICLFGLFLLYIFIPRFLKIGQIKFEHIKAAGLWARENTSQQAKFFIDPGLYNFRSWSKRSVYVTWSEGTRGLFNVEYCFNWWSRVKKLKVVKRADLKDFSKTIDLEMLENVKNEYDFKYVVAQKDIFLNLPVMYENKELTIYEYIGAGI